MDYRKKLINLELDILSHEDALGCLTGKADVVLPCPNVKACNNLDEYFMKSTSSSQKAQRGDQARSSKSGNKHETLLRTDFKQPFAVPLVRNFDKVLKKPDDAPIQGSPRLLSIVRRKSGIDVFSKVERLDISSGPLALLKSKADCVVRVLIRRRRKVPFISRVIEYRGTLVLFDKHMNLYLRDVVESFMYKRNEKMLQRARYRESIIVRGDNIILVSSQ